MLPAILLCAALIPCGLKAQDSQVTGGDNGGHGTEGHDGKKKKDDGKPEPKTDAMSYLGVQHIDPHGYGIRYDYDMSRYYVQEPNHEPYCLEAKGTTTDNKYYALKGLNWTFTITDGTNNLTLSGNGLNPIYIDSSKLTPPAGSSAPPADEIDESAPSIVASATLNFGNGSAPATFTAFDKGHVKFTIHYCGPKGCPNPCNVKPK
jgi:hypothetical protein